MTPSQFTQIGILGSGTMGAGIAQVCAQSGYAVLLYDIEQAFLDRARQQVQGGLQKAVEKGKLPAEKLEGALQKVAFHMGLPALAECDLIIEAVPEDLELKKNLFGQLDKICQPKTILASNTSSLSITALGGATQRPQQVAGLHFFNPVPSMRLVEIIQGQRTAGSTVETLQTFAKSLDKTTVIAKDTPGFIVNRVARPFYGEALKILGEHGSDPAQEQNMISTIDNVLKEAGGFKMGPFELMDLIGIDVNFAVTQSVWNAYFQESRYRPHPIQQRMVNAGLLGRKTGEGFYKYES